MSAKKNRPEGCQNKEIIDLKNDKKLRMYICGAAVAAAVVLTLLGCLYEPVSRLYDTAGIWHFLLRFVLLLASMAAYYYLYEYVRGLAIEKITGKKAIVLREKPFVYTSASRSLNPEEYLKISFAPVVLLGAALLLLMLILPAKLFWSVYIIQIINLAGSAGDVYVAYKLIKMKKDVRIDDDARTVAVWSKN